MKKSILGTGIFCLDIIEVRDYTEWPLMRPFRDREVLREVGGTCGNVMCNLATLGWDVRPVLRLDDSPEGLQMTADLKRYGCDCRHVSNTPDGGTTILWCRHKKNPDGSHKLSVRAGAPGGSRFPRRRFLRARDEAPAFLEALEETPSVFFFDDPAAGHRVLARGLRERGALVYFEPSRVAERVDLDAVAASNIVKFSDQRVPDVSFTDAFPDKVFIQTLGPEGVRVRYKGGEWETVRPRWKGPVVDTEGAGDWFSAAFLDSIAAKGGLSGGREAVMEAARAAIELASRSVGYMGSKGMNKELTTDTQ